MLENIRISFQGIWSHKMRSFLTMLGIIIGIASIIAIVSTIKGTSEQIKENLIGAGNNTVEINLKDGDNEYDAEMGMSSGKPPLLSKEIKQEVLDLEQVENATFYYSRSYTSSVYYQNTSFQGGKVYGIDENYLDTCGYQIQSGRAFIPKDYDEFRKVAIVDSNAAESLFPGEDPVGKTIEISQEPYTVVGVARKKDDFQPNIESIEQYYQYNESVTGCIMITSKSWPIAFQFDEPENVIIKADSTDSMSTAGRESAEVLNKAVAEGSKFKYEADDVLKKVKDMQKLSESTNQQLIWIASISLLVGGIGVMNIMLVSVTERTREIGIRKSLGAKRGTIMQQFVIEAAVTSSIGGIIGIILGAIVTQVAGNLIGITATPTPVAVIISFSVSVGIGLIFGYMPANRAAKLNPIDALRSD